MKFVITGAAGFIGFHLVKKLLDTGHDVIGIDNLNDYYDVKLKENRLKLLKSSAKFNFKQLDLNALDSLNESCDVAINLAAQAGARLDKSECYKYEHSNVKGFNSFLNFCKTKNIKKIIYASSSSVYENEKNIPFHEDFKIKTPHNPYAKSKFYNECLVESSYQNLKINIIGLRFFTVYGPFGRPDMAYYDFTKKVLQEEEITLFDSGRLQRDMTYIDDIINGIISSIKRLDSRNISHEIFNLGNDYPVKTLDIIKRIENEFNIKAVIKNIKAANEIKITHANLTKAKKCLGYRPKTSLDKGLGSFFSWFKEYYEI